MALVRDFGTSISFLGGHIPISGDLERVKEDLVSYVREQISTAVDNLKEEYPGREMVVRRENCYLDSVYLHVDILREETPKEAEARKKREEAAEIRAQKKKETDRKKDIAMLAKLSAKLGVQPPVIEERE